MPRKRTEERLPGLPGGPPASDLPMDIYVRVSAVGERGGDESYGSPEVQEEAARRWLAYKQVPEGRVLIDEDWSGGTQERPGLDAARDRALSGVTQGFVVYNVSRFSRFTEGGLRDTRLLRERGARIGFAQEDLDTNSVYGEMIFTILLAVHTAFLAQAKAGWKVVKARAIKEGRQIGPTPPGYVRTTVKNGRAKGSLAPDGERAQAITDAYNAVAREGVIVAAIPILEAAFPTKTFHVRKRKTAEEYTRRLGRTVEVGEEVTVPATWNPTTVRRVLASRVYLGEAFYGDEIDVNPHAHPALIDGVTWRRVCKIIDIPWDKRRAPVADFPLSGGHTVCATCGHPLIGGRMGRDRTNGGGRRGYICNTNKRKDRGSCAHPARIMAEPLEDHVREILAQHVADLEEASEEWLTVGEVRERLAANVGTLGPEDVPPEAIAALGDALPPVAEARAQLEAAEAEVAQVEALRGTIPETALDAALTAVDRKLHEARQALDIAEAGVTEERGLPDSTEIATGPTGALGEYLDAYRLVVRVEPAFGDRRRGRVPERATLIAADN